MSDSGILQSMKSFFYKKMISLTKRPVHVVSASVLLVAVVATTVLLVKGPVLGASFIWTQTDWSGGADGGTGASNPTDQSGWNKFSSITNVSGTASPGNAVLASVNFTATDDGVFSTTGAATGGGFLSGTTSNTTVSGSGVAADIKLTSSTVTANTFDTSLAHAPGAITLDSKTIRNGADDEMYVLRGGDSDAFFKYSISGNIWTTLAVLPIPTFGAATMIRNGTDNDIYVITNFANGFGRLFKYSISGNSWSTLANIPFGVGPGASMIRNGADNDIYVAQGHGTGDGTAFYKYSISGNTWIALAATPNSPGDGSKMIRNAADDDIYLTRGNFNTGFYKYSISGNTWTALTAVPGAITNGGAMIRNGADDDIYVITGFVNGFHKYSISGNSWTTLAAPPSGIVSSGSALIRNSNDNDIYLLAGNVNGFFKYSISDNSWITLAVPPGAVFNGSAMIRNAADDQIYILQGNNTTNLWRYDINTTTFPASGTFTSAVIDTHGAAALGSLSWNATLPIGASLTMATRSGNSSTPDGTWSVFSSELTNSTGSPITSPVARYIQYRGTFATNNTAITPALNDVTLAYSAYSSSGNLISSSFDSAAVNNLIKSLSWSEDVTLPAGTTVTVSLRTASTASGFTGAWTDFTNNTTDCNKIAGLVTCLASAIPNALKSGGDDEFIQYKIGLTTTNGASTPVFGDIDIENDTPASSSGSGSGTINVVKRVINDNAGTKTVSDFPLFVNNILVASGVTNTFPAPGNVFTITEITDPNYTQTFSGDCDINGQLNLNNGDNKFCIVTNNDLGATVSVPPVPPLIDLVKVPSPFALPNGPGSVSYTYTLRNIGTVPVTSVTMVDDSCSPTLVTGDDNRDAKLDITETWIYRCVSFLNSTHTNTVVATGVANGQTATDIASVTVVVGAEILPPLIHVTKVPSVFTLPAEGGLVTYTKTVTNPGVAPLSNVQVTDDLCQPIIYISGDTNLNNLLDTDESWVYRCQSNLTKTTTNTAVVTGMANGLMARDFAITTVAVSSSSYQIDSTLASAPTISADKNLLAAVDSSTSHCVAGDLLKLANDKNGATQVDSTIYFCGTDAKRYPFPNFGTYSSWYKNFIGVKVLSPEIMASIPLGDNVTYRPGSRLLKIVTDIKTYAIAQDGLLRWLTNEAVASALYGSDWRTKVSDIPEELFNHDYKIGEQITLPDVINPVAVTPSCTTTTAFTRSLGIGDTDPQVLALQNLLQCLGDFSKAGTATGHFGPLTQDAVKNFQVANGIETTGSVGPATREALNRYVVR